MSYLFYNCNKLNNISWCDEILPTDMRYMFFNCYNIPEIDLPKYNGNTNYYINMTRMFYNCNKANNINFGVSTKTYFPNDIHEMFYNCTSLENLDLENIIKSDYIYDMSYSFYNCSNMSDLRINFEMWDMFKGCDNLETLDLSKFDTSNVKDMESMFEGCSGLISLSLENFDTSNVHYMNKMFKDCISLENLNIGNMETKSVGTMYQMLYNCSSLKYLNISSMTENGQFTSDMFTGTPSNFTFCIGENENIPNIFSLLIDTTTRERDCSNNCYNKNRVNIIEKQYCCPFVKYEDNCYEKCPSKTQVKEEIDVCEDFNCTNENEYYDYEQNNCIKNISGYYINDTVIKTIDKCHEDCLECKGRWSKKSTNCTLCNNTKPYIYLGNCYANCTPGFGYFNGKSRCKCFDKKCKFCTEQSLDRNLCESCNEGYFQKENDTTNYGDWINCYKDPENYYFENNIYKQCYKSCKYCTKKGDDSKHLCLSCLKDYNYGIKMDLSDNKTINCYPNCPYYYYFNESGEYTCTLEPKCPNEFDKLVDGHKRCVKQCDNIPDIPNRKYEFRKVCYEQCPPDKSFNETKDDYFCKITCPFEAPFEMVEKQICVNNCTIMERYYGLCRTNYKGNRSNDEVQDKVLANLEDDIIDTFDYRFLNENISIVLEEIDNTYEIVTTNKKESDPRTSDIQLGNCENTLKSYYDIPKEKPLYLLKLDAKREGMQNPKVEYLVFYPLYGGLKLEQLDLSLCEGDGVTLLFSANLTDDEDLYNKNSGYYNDVCYTYTSDDGTDIPIQIRQQQFAENNKSLCEEGCEFVKFHQDTEKAECSCNVKTDISSVSDIKIDKDTLYKFVDISKLINFDVMKCFNLFFDNKRISKNIGFFIFFPTFVMWFICILIFYIKEYKFVKDQVNEIVTAKIKYKYLIESGLGEKTLKEYPYHPVYLDFLKEKGKKLPESFQKRNIKNIKELNIEKKPNKKIIKIKKKVKLKIPKKKAEVKEGIKLENENTIENNNKSKIKDTKDILHNNKDIYNEDENTNVKKLNLRHKNPINAPPIKFSNFRSIKNNKDQRKLEYSQKNNIIETTVNNPELKADKNDLDLIYNYKGKLTTEERDKIKNVLKYNDDELNGMNYNDSLKFDHRNFFEYYFALLKNKHLIITFFETRDYNSRIIKIFLLFFSFASCYAINGLFFDDDTMHEIYEQKGSYNLIDQLPQILYSTILSYILDFLLNFLALSGDDITELKQEKEMKIIDKKKAQTLKTIHIKFILFFIISFLLLVLFWYYIGCFCAVYNNTQYHLLKDTLISFATSMGTPFAMYLFPAIFRWASLRKKSKPNQVIFIFSKILQFF